MRVWELLTKLGLADDLRAKTASPTTPDPSTYTLYCERSYIHRPYITVDALIFRKSDQPEGLEFYKLVTNGTSQLQCPRALI
jgi:salicylate hydroxylase